jgi:outer membrane lipoprotein-sorting protein
LALTGILVTAGCRAGRLRPALPETLPTADRIMAEIAARRQALTSVRGFARVSYESGDAHAAARHAIVVALPDRFRLETLSPIGAVALVVCDGRELAVWVRRDHRTYRGTATPASVAAYTGLPIDVADVASVLAGLPPERRMIGDARVTRDDAARLVRVRVPIEGGRQDVWVAPDSMLPAASETTLESGRALRVELGNYRTIGGLAFPLSIDMRLLPDGGHIHVGYETPAIGGLVDADVFGVPPRPGVDEVRLDGRVPGALPFGADD